MTTSAESNARGVIPVCEPLLAGNELAYVSEAVRTGWISSAGPFVERFEQEFAAYVGVAHGVSTTSGTTALHLALVALGVGPGDEVIVPSFTMAACGFAVAYTGATPVFVDVCPNTWTMDVGLARSALTERTRAIMPVHIFGVPCDMDALVELASSAGVALLEDGAEAHGAVFGNSRVGSFGDCAAFSFYANKNLTTGEGGMVVTDDPGVAERLRYFRNMCFPQGHAREYRHEDLGFNYRMSNLHAAIGVAQVEKADDYRAARVRNGLHYRDRLSRVPGVEMQVLPKGRESVYWMNAIVLADDVPLSVDDVERHLGEAGVQTRRLFQGLHRQGAFRKPAIRRVQPCPVTDRLAARGLYLPSGSGLISDEIDFVCDLVRDVIENA